MVPNETDLGRGPSQVPSVLYGDSLADSDEVAQAYRYEVARGFRDDVAHLSDLISPSGEAFWPAGSLASVKPRGQSGIATSTCFLLLRLLWACGQRDCVVQAQRHVHSATGSGLSGGLPGSPQALTGEVEPMGIVDETIEHGVGIGGISNEQMPLVHGELAGDDGGAMTVAIFEDFQEVVTGTGVERLESQSSRISRSTRPRPRNRRGWRPSPRASARSSNSRGTR